MKRLMLVLSVLFGQALFAEVLQTITITPDLIKLKEGASLPLHAIGHYSTGVEKEITSKVEWSVANTQFVTIDANATLHTLKEGTTTITAKLGNVESSSEVTVYWEVNGHRLPPEPDPAVNNSTLLGIDSNNNGVRDDVERYIYKTYDKYIPCHQVPDGNYTLPSGEIIPLAKEICEDDPIPYHPIVRAIAMQGAGAAQIIIQEPKKARQTMKYFDDAVGCSIFFSVNRQFRTYNGKRYEVIDRSLMREREGLIDVFFNTVMRARAYAKYNFYLSGGVYSANETDEELLDMCSDEVKELYKGL